MASSTRVASATEYRYHGSAFALGSRPTSNVAKAFVISSKAFVDVGSKFATLAKPVESDSLVGTWRSDAVETAWRSRTDAANRSLCSSNRSASVPMSKAAFR